jgi:murein DD-endopeptidase MepM/ murein hydrolase activator NlpD
MTLVVQPPLTSCTKEYQHQFHENRKANYRGWAIASLTYSLGLIPLFIFLSPLNFVVKATWRSLGLPNTDSQKAIAVLNYKTDADFTKPVKEGDKILGYEVTSGFGDRVHPLSGVKKHHNGIDLATPEGTPLYVVGRTEGNKAFTGYADIWCDHNLTGRNAEGIAAYVKVPDFPDVELVYWHLKSCDGGRRDVGAKFAETGNTGDSTGAHLHFGIRVVGDWAKLNFKSEWQHPTTGIVRWSLEGKEPQKVSTKPIVERLRNAIAGQESNHDPSAVNPHSNALGYGQVMPENIKSWTKQCLGKELTEAEFLANKAKQIQVIDCKLDEALQETAKTSSDEDTQIRKAASIWYSGRSELYDNTNPQTYGAGDYPSIQDYTKTVLERFKKQ